MAQERVQKQGKGRAQEEESTQAGTSAANAELAEKTQDTLDSIDDVLDAQLDEELLADMDDILEENAQEFVEGFVQQGGQ